jgi:hypothetical protein
MTNNQKAINMLVSKDITAQEENDTVYVRAGNVQLEISEFEINFQAERFDEYVKENGENPS